MKNPTVRFTRAPFTERNLLQQDHVPVTYEKDMTFAPPDRCSPGVMDLRTFGVIHPPQFMVRALVLCDIVVGEDYLLYIPENPTPSELPISRASWLIEDHLRLIRRARDGPGFMIIPSAEDSPFKPSACLHPTYNAPRLTEHAGTDLCTIVPSSSMVDPASSGIQRRFGLGPQFQAHYAGKKHV